MKLTKFINPIAVIVLVALLRILPHPANVAPITAMALFGGAYLDKKYALFVPLAALFASDMVLGFHQSMPYVYGSFILIGLIGMLLKKKKTVFTIFAASLASSIIFFLITNFGFFLSYSLYPKTFEGQMTAYYMALPFFRNTVLGDLFYTGLLFGGYHFLTTSLHIKTKTTHS